MVSYKRKISRLKADFSDKFLNYINKVENIMDDKKYADKDHLQQLLWLERGYNQAIIGDMKNFIKKRKLMSDIFDSYRFDVNLNEDFKQLLDVLEKSIRDLEIYQKDLNFSMEEFPINKTKIKKLEILNQKYLLSLDSKIKIYLADLSSIMKSKLEPFGEHKAFVTEMLGVSILLIMLIDVLSMN